MVWAWTSNVYELTFFLGALVGLLATSCDLYQEGSNRCIGSLCQDEKGPGGKADTLAASMRWERVHNQTNINLELVGPGLDEGQVFAGPSVGTRS